MEYMQEANMPLTLNIDMDAIKQAFRNKDILCSKALVYEKDVGLHFNLCGYKAVMPMNEIAFTPDMLPIKEAVAITRVNKNVCFVINDIQEENGQPVIYISRKKVQEKAYKEYISSLKPGDVIKCCITHIDSFGVFCDVAFGISALLPIDFISVSRINSPSDRFTVGQNIYACIKSIGREGRIVLSHKELLGTWLENAKLFSPMTTAVGIVRSIENYGIFIELMPNLAGLAEICEGINVGDVVNVYIKSILPDKMKVKLVIMSTLRNYTLENKIKYFINQGHIEYWKYSTDGCKKLIETDF